MFIFMSTLLEQKQFQLVLLALKTLLTAVLVARQPDHSHYLSLFSFTATFIGIMLVDIPSTHNFWSIFLKFYKSVCENKMAGKGLKTYRSLQSRYGHAVSSRLALIKES